MKRIKKIIASFLILKRGIHQERRQFDKVVELSQKVKELDPRSYLAFLMLSDDLIRLKRYEEAKIIIEEAILIFPEKYLFYQLMINCLSYKHEPVEHFIPHIKSYFEHKSIEESKYHWVMKLLFKVIKSGTDLDAYLEDIRGYQAEWEKWAVNMLHQSQIKPESAQVLTPVTLH